MPTVRSTYALELETKWSSSVKLPFQVLLRSEAFVGKQGLTKNVRVRLTPVALTLTAPA
jgi:hypothetical protein